MTKPRTYAQETRCPLDYAFDVCGGRWKARILCVLSQFAPLRYGALRAQVPGVSDAMLSSSLKELVEDGMVLRDVPDGAAARAEYALTQKGMQAAGPLHALCAWARRYRTFPLPDAADACHTCLFDREDGCEQLAGEGVRHE